MDHNLALLRGLRSIASIGVPVLAGLSRKAMLGRITGKGPGERVHASVAAALIAIEEGASVVRVHDVAATADAMAVWRAVRDTIGAVSRADLKQGGR
jgi:dihydropteroate synthase